MLLLIILINFVINSVVNGQKINGVSSAANNTSNLITNMKNNSTPSSASTATTSNTNRQKVVANNRDNCHYSSGYPKPAYSNACLIALGTILFFKYIILTLPILVMKKILY